MPSPASLPTRRAWIVALALVVTVPLGVLSAPGGQAQDDPVRNSDLTVVDLRAFNTTYEGAEPVRVVATVMNLGPEDTGTPAGEVHFRYNDAERCLTGETAADQDDPSCNQPFNVSESLAAGETTEVPVDWEPTEDEIGNGTLIAIVESQWEPDGAQGNNRMDRPVFVNEFNLTFETVDDEERSTLPGQAVPYRVDVRNSGNVEALFRTNVSSRLEDDEDDDGAEAWELPDGWESPTSPENFTLGPGESRTVTALLRAPPDATEVDEVNVSINVTAHLPALGFTYHENITHPLPVTGVITELPDDYAQGVAVEPIGNASFVGPDPGTHVVSWRLNNTGSRPDAYEVDPTVEGELAQYVTVEPPPVTALNASENGTARVRVHVQEPVPVGTPGTLVAAVKSVNDDPTEPPTTAEHELVGSGPNLRVEDVQTPEPVYASDGAATVTVSVRNTANLPAPSANLTLRAIRAGFSSATATATIPALEPGGNRTLDVPLPVADLGGQYVVEAAANRPDRAFNETDETDNTASADLFVRTASLTVRPARSLTLEPGGYARFVRPPTLFEVANDGNARERVRVTVETSQGWYQDERSLSVAAGVSAGVPLEFRIPEFPGVPATDIEVTASLVNLTDDAGTDATDANATRLNLLDEEPPEVVDASLPESRTATRPFHVNATFRDAVGVDRAWMILDLPGGGTERVDLASRGEESFGAELTLYDLGEYRATLHATDRSPDNNTYEDLEPRSFEIVYNRTPSLELVHPTSGALRSGESVQFNVTDPAGFSALNATVQGEDLQLEGDQSIDTSDWTEGTYEIRVSAVNRYGLSNETTYRIEVDNTAPAVENLAVRPRQPSPGETVTIEAAVDGNATNVTARLKAPQEPASDIQLEQVERGLYRARTELPAGTYEVTVLASDAAGNTASPPQPVELDVAADAPASGWAALVAAALGAAAATARRSRA